MSRSEPRASSKSSGRVRASLSASLRGLVKARDVAIVADWKYVAQSVQTWRVVWHQLRWKQGCGGVAGSPESYSAIPNTMSESGG